jgi:5-hydroxyisourate hydrolase
VSVSTHVLDAAIGRPAAGMAVRLEAAEQGGWAALALAHTDRDGRVREAFAAAGDAPGPAAGTYRLVFDTAGYFAGRGVKEFFYPEVVLCFAIADAEAHYHVPLLLSPFAYSTYRGS